ncbi:hypothetical protein M5K25_002651 [Dendrobium thyrsiflorum]|uniref:Uncharacterized protein n=1 Tax=Dendrobium thyrsiflorum TaxID=117978 RepID=A0ABD0VNV2_DENTH
MGTRCDAYDEMRSLISTPEREESQLLFQTEFDATKEHIGSGHNHNLLVSFGGKTIRFRGPRVITVYPAMPFGGKTVEVWRSRIRRISTGTVDAADLAGFGQDFGTGLMSKERVPYLVAMTLSPTENLPVVSAKLPGAMASISPNHESRTIRRLLVPPGFGFEIGKGYELGMGQKWVLSAMLGSWKRR